MANKKSRGNGQGSFYQDTDGVWHGLYFDVYGNRKHIKQRKNENKTAFKDRFNESRLKAQKGIIEENLMLLLLTFLQNILNTSTKIISLLIEHIDETMTH